MKHFFLILLFSIAIVSNSNAQDAPKKSTKAIIEYNNKGEALQKIAWILSEKGFYFDEVNETIGIMSTGILSDGKTEYRLNVVVDGEGNAMITGLYRVDVIDNKFSIIENRGMNGSPVKNAWNILEEVATATGMPVRYE